MKIHTKADYRAIRKARYPDVGEQLDAIVALTDYLRANGHQLPEKTRLWLDACLEIKKRIRKT
jgi:hypothetical protein